MEWQVNRVQAVTAGQTSLSPCGVHRVPGTGLAGSRMLQKGQGPLPRAACLTALPSAQALPHLLLLFGLVVSMALIWHPTNKLAALLPLPYLAWLTVITSITYHL